MNPRRGTTMAELIAALLILTPFIVVVVGLFPYAHSNNWRAWAFGMAQELARSRMEELRRCGDDAAQVLARHLYENGPSVPGLEPDLESVLRWLLAKAPADRSETARQARLALERLLLARAG